MPASHTAILWFRQDLRLSDNPAFRAAAAFSGRVIPAYIWAPEDEAPWAPGAASRWWLHHSLEALDASLRARGLRLILRKGRSALAVLRQLLAETGADAVCWNARYEPGMRERDARVETALRDQGIAAQCFHSSLLVEPEHFRNAGGGPFQVFTAFWKALERAYDVRTPDLEPMSSYAPARWPESLALPDLGLLPSERWVRGFGRPWLAGRSGRIGEAAAQRRLTYLIKRLLAGYPARRDFPEKDATSRLSPALHFGEITPRQIWYALQSVRRRSREQAVIRGIESYLRQLAWREFAHHLMVHFPKTPALPLRPAFARFPWRRDANALDAWQRGLTGYPIVDAGMRQLWRTGWMHNRVRMIAGSFLVKDLLVDWRAGAAWFWDTLVDADLANNTLGWQWVAGCGADAAPYFRVFNPVLQGRKFDPSGAYVKQWVPELARLTPEWVHRPWEAPEPVLRRARVEIGRDYPAPIVAHGLARERALKAFARLKAAPRVIR